MYKQYRMIFVFLRCYFLIWGNTIFCHRRKQMRLMKHTMLKLDKLELTRPVIQSKYSIFVWLYLILGSQVAQMTKNLPAMRETWVRSLGQEDPLEEEMATPSSILPEKSHGQRSPAGYSPWGCSRTRPRDWITSFTSLTFAFILQFCHELGLGSLTHCDFT